MSSDFDMVVEVDMGVFQRAFSCVGVVLTLCGCAAAPQAVEAMPAQPSDGSGDPTVKALQLDWPCDVQAEAPLPAGASKQFVRTWQASKTAHAGSGLPPGLEQARDQVVGLRSDGAAVVHTSVMRVPFGAIEGVGPADLVNPRRCVWVVTVEAPFTAPSRAGATPRQYPRYAAVIDVATGEQLGLLAGPQMPNGTTGAGLVR